LHNEQNLAFCPILPVKLSIIENSEYRYEDVVGEKQSNEIGDLMGTDDECMSEQRDSAGLMTLNVLLVTDL
jgi:hypothetical protein